MLSTILFAGLAQRFAVAKVFINLKEKQFRPTLVHVLRKRIELFMHGNRDGVSLNFLQNNSNGFFTSIEDLIYHERELPKEILKHLEVARNLFENYSNCEHSITSSRWNAELHLFSLLYSFIRSNRVKNIVETGVANGFTTNAVMRALEENNNSGTLHSFDVLPETEKVYSGVGNWNFHLLNPRKAHKQITQITSKIPKIDLWIHDSNHGYRWQKFEYQLAFARLSQNGILISDDIEASPAWGELSRSHFRKSYILFDSRKFVGIALK
jgi:predicted O-methyltransferase YrrM